MEYDNDNRPVKVLIPGHEQTWVISYNPMKMTNREYMDGELTGVYEYTYIVLENGCITKMTCTDTDYQLEPDDEERVCVYEMRFTYDEDNHLIRIDHQDKMTPNVTTNLTLTWRDGLLVSTSDDESVSYG